MNGESEEGTAKYSLRLLSSSISSVSPRLDLPLFPPHRKTSLWKSVAPYSSPPGSLRRPFSDGRNPKP